MPTLLTIAGHDPSSGAGITADLAVMAAHHHFGTSAITALTVQSTIGVARTHPVDPDILKQTLDFLHDDLPPAGIKIGMLASAPNVTAVAEYVRTTKIPIVLDPILRSTSGHPLLDEPGVAILRRQLLPLVDWITPNLSELGILLGRQIIGEEAIEAAARELSSLGRGLNVVVTGGDQSAGDFVWLATGTGEWLRGEKLASPSTHGTGCAFSTALLCRLVQKELALNATRLAKHYVTEAIRRATPLGSGNGPMNLLWPLD